MIINSDEVQSVGTYLNSCFPLYGIVTVTTFSPFLTFPPLEVYIWNTSFTNLFQGNTFSPADTNS